jgi:hypothetical protein
MTAISESDPARFYQDSPFPGRRLLAWSIGIWVVVGVLPRWFFNIEALPGWIETTQSLLALPAIPLYFVGFWKAIVGKG